MNKKAMPVKRIVQDMIAIKKRDRYAQPVNIAQEALLLFDKETLLRQMFDDAREHGFPYPDLSFSEMMRECNALAEIANRNDFDALEKTTLCYRVADTFHKHRFAANAQGMMSSLAAFNDDALLYRALHLMLENNVKELLPIINMVSGVQTPSNFRPGVACRYYREFCTPGDWVLDTSTGYGGRLLGWYCANLAGKYIGIDPNTETHSKNWEMIFQLLGGPNRLRGGKYQLLNMPAEDVKIGAGRQEIAPESCDFAFTSPPYFAKEHYSTEATQSYRRYRTADVWIEKFLCAMLRLQYRALKPGKTNIVNIQDVEFGSKTLPLVQITIDEAKTVGFELAERRELRLPQRMNNQAKASSKSEAVLIFRKN